MRHRQKQKRTSHFSLDKPHEVVATAKQLAEIKYALDQSAIVAVTDQRGKILFVNEKFCEISQYKKEELLGNNHKILNSSYHSLEFFKEMWRTIGTGNVWRGEIRNKAKDGSYYWVDTTIVPFLDNKGKPYQYISIRYEVTDRKLMEKEVRDSEEMYRIISENSSDLIALIDVYGYFTYASPSHLTTLQVNRNKLREVDIYHFIHKEDRSQVKDSILHLIRHGEKEVKCEYRLKTEDDSTIYVESLFSPIYDEDNKIKHLTVVARDVTDRKESEQMIYHLAYHDVLTDLPNRRLFMKRLESLMLKASRLSHRFAILYIDIDNFKGINDLWGHEVGDTILTKFAKRLMRIVYNHDFISRVAGDQFAVIIERFKNISALNKTVQNFINELEAPIMFKNQQFDVTCSIGVSLFPNHGRSGEELLINADTAMEYIKRQSDNRYAIYNDSMEQETLKLALLEKGIRQAIKEDQFYLLYQPKVNFATNELIGVEALIRWEHPKLGIISPDEFISIAEQSGLIHDLGEWVLREACEQNKQWQDQGLPPIPIAVNMSVLQLEDLRIVNKIKQALNDFNLDAKWLELEMTESMFADIDFIVSLLTKIKALGASISIDDFGSGYSSFNYLKRLPIDVLKIDRLFINEIEQNIEDREIIKAIIALANTLKIETIAEGIETKRQVSLLKDIGYSNGQGFYFSKPLSAEQFEHYLSNYQKYNTIKYCQDDSNSGEIDES